MRIFIYTIVSLIFLTFPPEAGARERVEGPVLGQVLGVLDGDTINIRAHVWIGTEVETHVRINGIDAPEIHGKCEAERTKAIAAREEIVRLLGTDGRVVISNIRYEKYAGRVLAEARTTDGVDIAKHMIDMGLARPYHGRKRASWCVAANMPPISLP